MFGIVGVFLKYVGNVFIMVLLLCCLMNLKWFVLFRCCVSGLFGLVVIFLVDRIGRYEVRKMNRLVL